MPSYNLEQIPAIVENMFTNQERVNYKNVWEVISSYMLPTQSKDFVQQLVKGSLRTQRLNDSTAMMSNRDLSFILSSTLVNPNIDWASVSFGQAFLNQNPELLNNIAVRRWLQSATETVFNVLRESNFYSEFGRGMPFLTAFGNMCIFPTDVSPDSDFRGLSFQNWSLNEVAVLENGAGVIDTVARKANMPNSAIIDRWGSKLSPDTLMALEENPTGNSIITMFVGPRPKKEQDSVQDARTPAKGRPFRIAHYFQNELLEDDGFFDQPVYFGRWSTNVGEIYGSGAGIIALPDTLSLNHLKRLNFIQIGNNITPSYFVERGVLRGAIDQRANGVTTVSTLSGIRENTSTSTAQFNLVNMDTLRSSIQSAFFLDKLVLPPRQETGGQTALEVSARLEQVQRVLGPIAARINEELLEPILTRVFRILHRRGDVFPEMPEAIQGLAIDLDFTFTNQISRSVQSSDLIAVSQWVGDLATIDQVTPQASVLDNVNADAIAKLSARKRNVPAEVINTQEEVEGVRAQRAVAQQQQAQMQQATQVADIASKLPTDSE